MLEIRNPNGSWPKKIELKLYKYPNTNDIRQWSFDVLDTVGKLVCIIIHCKCQLSIDSNFNMCVL